MKEAVMQIELKYKHNLKPNQKIPNSIVINKLNI
jgi:hypothetical protein